MKIFSIEFPCPLLWVVLPFHSGISSILLLDSYALNGMLILSESKSLISNPESITAILYSCFTLESLALSSIKKLGTLSISTETIIIVIDK